MANIETKREKFIRIAEARTNKIIDMVQLLGNCSNVAVYEYTEADINRMFDAIDAEVKAARKKFVKSEPKTKFKFDL